MLGEGKFAKVFLVSLKHEPNNFYAMKILDKRELIKLHQVTNTMTELRILKNLTEKKSEVAPKVYQAFQTSDRLFLVT